MSMTKLMPMLIAGVLIAACLLFGGPQVAYAQTGASNSCSGGDFLGLPSWYDGVIDSDCSIHIDAVSDIWKILLNVIKILLRLSIYVAVGFIIYGGVQFVISQGSPDKVAAAKKTILNAVIGLVLGIMATTIVVYISGLF